MSVQHPVSAGEKGVPGGLRAHCFEARCSQVALAERLVFHGSGNVNFNEQV